MKIRVLLFAGLRELAGQPEIDVTLEDSGNLSDLWEALCQQRSALRDFGKSAIFAVNQEFAESATVLHEGDEVAMFPPVSGGAYPPSKGFPGEGGGDVIQIVRGPIAVEPLLRQLSQPEDGAVVVFSGIVRNHSNGKQTRWLEYEGYEPMALKELNEIARTLKRRWDIGRIGILHRLGRLEIGETSVLIVVTAAHRRAAFEACQYAIDALKQKVPIWKKEFFEDGAVWAEGETTIS